ncbi:class I SAM-dependent methyltransferase [Pelomonas sp. CA6]|uniref:class I SAM-dependent methyltransferase n=1 Tax=Pelomonas sp. CA6 TaxID=2907999 RepID=UPI001F4BFC9B|nr:class I SAM-dependent methyltransferase [Pelomonas sp. CA6]MCH7344169.1 class I SAM-dependent methyltransferase [Pelomonas sp. CA6]
MSSTLSERLLHKYYSGAVHPYRLFEQHAEALMRPGMTLLDAGCGRSAPVLRKYLGRVQRLIGIDLVEFVDVAPGIETYNADLGRLPLEDASVDLIMSRSVFEHLADPQAVYAEMARVLKPGGTLIFLTANLWDYGTLAARLIPNRWHGRVVRYVEGRKEEDTFPTQYKTNTRGDIERLARGSGLRLQSLDYLNQYPNYFMFNGALFFLGMCFERVTSRFDALKLLRGWLLVTLVKPQAAAPSAPGGQGG